jgi:Tol biopolymer transport system component
MDAQTVIVVGGWHPEYARVLDVQTDGRWAAALVDPNSDGADLNVELYLRDPDGHWSVAASGNGSLSMGPARALWTDDDQLLLIVEEDPA